jgi:hypothetical protein
MPTTLERAEALADSIMAEIRELQSHDLLPKQLHTFAELHEHCDANTLGDADALIEELGMDDALPIIHLAQGMVDARLQQEDNKE